jgi:GTP pyrophosphokinase
MAARFSPEHYVVIEKALGAIDTPSEVSLNMAGILFSLEADAYTIAAALLFTAVADKTYSGAQLEKNQDHQVVKLLGGALQMRLFEQTAKASSGQERFRKMLLAMINDVRVVLLKLAERVATIRNYKNVEDKALLLLAKSIQQVYAPLANRLGLSQLKWELEDRAFSIVEPQAYRDITAKLSAKRLERERYISEFVASLEQRLAADSITCEIGGRVKHIYSIWRKMQKKELSFEQLFDIQAVRIVVKDVPSCYEVLSLLNADYDQVHSEFDDYIATPKSNGYQSIQLVVKGPEDKLIEVQVRSFAMHEFAEQGMAAHWRYKEGGKRDESLEQRITWLRSLLDWQADFDDTETQAKPEDRRIYVFTPQGEVIDLPVNATPVDFAYHVHTEVGHRCRGAKVNGRMVPLNFELATGDKLEIITGKDSAPSRDWLSEGSGYLKSSKARTKVAHWFRLEHKEQYVTDGKARLQKELNRAHIKTADFDALAKAFQFKHVDDLFAAIATGDVKSATVVRSLAEVVPLEPKLTLSKPKAQKRKSPVVVDGIDNVLTQMAKCCKPVVGDTIIGYITQGRGAKIHRQDCPNVKSLSGASRGRLIAVSWSEDASMNYPVDLTLFVQAQDGLVRDITGLLSQEKIPLLAISTQFDHKKDQAVVWLTVEVGSTVELEKMQKQLSHLDGVLTIRRGR